MRGRQTTWGLFSSNGKLPSSVLLWLIHSVLFVTSDFGSSSAWTLQIRLQAGPAGWGTAAGFVFGGVFLLLGVYLCEGRAQRGPLVQRRVLGSLKTEPPGQYVLVLSTLELDILFRC